MKLIPLDATDHGDHFNIFFVICQLRLIEKNLKINKNLKENSIF